ncbi:hypothetical protein WEI85_44965 [Actinomycetes bacterium KLBMP 9797]
MATPQPMSRDEVDFALVGLVAAHDRISAAMYAVDAHPAWSLLRAADIRGATKRAADEAGARVDALWSQFSALRSVLDRVRAVRGQRSRPGEEELEELTILLRGPVLALGPDGMVLDDPLRGPPSTWVTAMGLAQDVEGASAELADLLDGAQAARDEAAAAFDALTAALDQARATARSLGDPAIVSDVDAIDVRVAEAVFAAMRDPLDAAGPPAALARDVESGAARVAEFGRLRDAYPDRVRRLRAAIEEVAQAEAATAQAYALALEKIANPGLPAAPDAVGPLRAHLAQLDQLHRERRWPRLATELSIVERSVAQAKERAAHLHEAADGLLRRRAELRGRLDAYRARAGRLALAEHEQLAARHRAALELLYTSPCDLPAATRAVVAYQRYLNELTERGQRA